jgi:hypothetical protein
MGDNLIWRYLAPAARSSCFTKLQIYRNMETNQSVWNYKSTVIWFEAADAAAF